MPSGRRWLAHSTAYAMMVGSMMDAAYTIEELVKISGLAWTTTWKFVKALHRREKAYVAVWRTDSQGRYTKAAYKLGTLPDMPRPAPKGDAVRGRAYRKRLAERNPP